MSIATTPQKSAKLRQERHVPPFVWNPGASVLNIRGVPIFALTIFLSAFLLFQVQPLIAKYILPWFGGGSGVWTTCMLFFQVLLLGGYAYAHLVTRWLRPRKQVIVHLVLLLASLAMLPITPSAVWKPTGLENPVFRILTLLTATLGLPYFMLSATGPLLQRWFILSQPRRSPYRLFALSNAGSLLALISYPLVFENYFIRSLQARLWGWGLVSFCALCAWCGVRVWTGEGKKNSPALPAGSNKAARDLEPGPFRPESRFGFSVLALWLALPACASVLLLATTNKICQDVAVIPFLWVLPLSLYLLSFIICFDSPRWYARVPFGLALLAALVWLCWALPRGTGTSLRVLVGGYLACLFLGCMVCHGELYRLKPDPGRLTTYYLMIAAGGALGGVLVAVVAPLVFNSFHELPLGFIACALLCLLTWLLTAHRGPSAAPERQRQFWRRPSTIAGTGGLALIVVAGLMWQRARQSNASVVERTRNFYGVLTVREEEKDKPNAHAFLLQHGDTLHGLQLAHPIGARMPTLYYGPNSGVGRAFLSRPLKGRRFGLVGLGIGTLAAYGHTNDYFRFYEIDPAVMRVATKFFTYAPHSAAKADCVIGDARLSLEKEPPQNFDVLVLDAFSGDSIPVHLLTREAFGVYARHLNPSGIIAIHTSNNYLDLEPLLISLAQALSLHLAVIEDHPAPKEFWLRPTLWILLSPDPQALNAPEIRQAARAPKTPLDRVRYWTDDFTSLYRVLR